MRVMISGGGTGGGVYPALAVVEALKARQPDTAFLWVGGKRGPERDLVEREGIAFEAVPGGPIAGVGARALISLPRIAAGTLRALGLVRRFRPDVLLMTGGWVTIPATLACWLSGVPVVILMPDLEPGGTIRVLSRVAARVAVVAPESARFFRPGQAIETGYPVRPALLRAAGYDVLGQPLGEAAATRERARKRFGLAEGMLTLLVSGGSTGARSINRALTTSLERILACEGDGPGCQIIHISGRLDQEWVQRRADELPPELAARYHPVAYLHTDDMALALAAADLVVSRAGASTLGEFPLFGLPAILVPYPHAWRYQKTNAEYLVSRRAALRLDDDRLEEDLAPLVCGLLKDGDRRERMAASCRALRRPDAAARVAEVLAGPVQAASTESRGKGT